MTSSGAGKNNHHFLRKRVRSLSLKMTQKLKLNKKHRKRTACKGHENIRLVN